MSEDELYNSIDRDGGAIVEYRIHFLYLGLGKTYYVGYTCSVVRLKREYSRQRLPVD